MHLDEHHNSVSPCLQSSHAWEVWAFETPAQNQLPQIKLCSCSDEKKPDERSYWQHFFDSWSLCVLERGSVTPWNQLIPGTWFNKWLSGLVWRSPAGQNLAQNLRAFQPCRSIWGGSLPCPVLSRGQLALWTLLGVASTHASVYTSWLVLRKSCSYTLRRSGSTMWAGNQKTCFVVNQLHNHNHCISFNASISSLAKIRILSYPTWKILQPQIGKWIHLFSFSSPLLSHRLPIHSLPSPFLSQRSPSLNSKCSLGLLALPWPNPGSYKHFGDELLNARSLSTHLSL